MSNIVGKYFIGEKKVLHILNKVVSYKEIEERYRARIIAHINPNFKGNIIKVTGEDLKGNYSEFILIPPMPTNDKAANLQEKYNRITHSIHISSSDSNIDSDENERIFKILRDMCRG